MGSCSSRWVVGRVFWHATKTEPAEKRNQLESVCLCLCLCLCLVLPPTSRSRLNYPSILVDLQHVSPVASTTADDCGVERTMMTIPAMMKLSGLLKWSKIWRTIVTANTLLYSVENHFPLAVWVASQQTESSCLYCGSNNVEKALWPGKFPSCGNLSWSLPNWHRP